jgi:hypothetical protein
MKIKAEEWRTGFDKNLPMIFGALCFSLLDPDTENSRKGWSEMNLMHTAWNKNGRSHNFEETDLWEILARSTCVNSFKGTQEWEFFWLRFWILYYFIVSYAKILRFCKKNFMIGPVLEEVRFFRVVPGLRGMKKIFELGQKNIFTLYMSKY